jgi:hypothetical protein
MLAVTFRVIVAMIAAAALATPVMAHRNSDVQLDTRLMELRGEITQVYRERGPDKPTQIALFIRNVDYRGASRPGHNVSWHIYLDSRLLEAAGITKPVLYEQKQVTFVGYRADNGECGGFQSKCFLAARQIRFDNGCTVFVGRAAPVFGIRPYAYGWNVPVDGLDKVDGSGSAACVLKLRPSTISTTSRGA